MGLETPAAHMLQCVVGDVRVTTHASTPDCGGACVPSHLDPPAHMKKPLGLTKGFHKAGKKYEASRVAAQVSGLPTTVSTVSGAPTMPSLLSLLQSANSTLLEQLPLDNLDKWLLQSLVGLQMGLSTVPLTLGMSSESVRSLLKKCLRNNGGG